MSFLQPQPALLSGWELVGPLPGQAGAQHVSYRKFYVSFCLLSPPPPPPHASPPHIPVSSSRNLLPPSGFCFSDAICQIKLPWYCTALVLSCLPHCAHIIVPTCCAWYSTATVSCQSRVGAQQPGPPPIRPAIAPKGKERELSMRLE